MQRKLLALTLLGLPAIAWAASSWSSFAPAFPGLPCNDGWAACLVEGKVVSPGMVLDAGGRPHAADMRVGFFDLDPLPGFSPFNGLSAYNGEVGGVADAAPDQKEERKERDPDAPTVASRNNPDGEEEEEEERPAAPPVIASKTPVTNDEDYGMGAAPVVASKAPAPAPAPAPVIASKPPEPPPVVAAKAVEPPAPVVSAPPVLKSAPPAPAPAPAPAAAPSTARSADAVAMAEVPKAPPAVATAPIDDGSCDDLVTLEAPAMMGQLGVGRRKCLEGTLASESSQTRKNKISRVLVADAEARGDRADWERLMKRHLEDIDRSDPNLCMKYAVHLSRGGVGRAHGVIRWADYALENKQVWSGATYTKNVDSLYKLRAQAANRLWQDAEAKFVAERNEANEGAAAKYRGTAKDYAREWLDYARASGGDIKQPMALCVSAAGSKEFCEG